MYTRGQALGDVRRRLLPQGRKNVVYKDYTLIGTQAEQKKFIGNAVEVNMSRVLCEALARKLMDKAA